MTGRRPSFGRLLRGIAGEAVVTSAGERAQSLYSQPVNAVWPVFFSSYEILQRPYPCARLRRA